jgi:hypothetical protein
MKRENTGNSQLKQVLLSIGLACFESQCGATGTTVRIVTLAAPCSIEGDR